MVDCVLLPESEVQAYLVERKRIDTLRGCPNAWTLQPMPQTVVETWDSVFKVKDEDEKEEK